MQGHPVKAAYNPKPVEALAPSAGAPVSSSASSKSAQKGSMVTINQKVKSNSTATNRI